MNATILRKKTDPSLSLLIFYTLALSTVLFLAVGPVGADEARYAWFSRFEWSNRDSIESKIANIADCHMNGVLFQVRGEADAFYISTWEPWSHLVGDQYPGYDPLAVAIYEAHRQGLELHAYVNALPMWGQSFDPASDRHIYNAHPDWVMVNSSGEPMNPEDGYAFASPGIPQFREHLNRVIMDIVTRYDVDGIHLDYIRYPSTAYSYDDSSLARFEREYSCPPESCTGYWTSFRRRLVTEVVSAAYDSVTALKPWVKISAAVWGQFYWGYNDYLQDSHVWLDSGFVDFNCPMVYTDNTSTFQSRLHDHAVAKYGRHVYGGIGAYLLDDATLAAEIGICRSEGVEGQALFAAVDLYGDLKDTLIAAGGPYESPADLPAMAWKSAKPFTVSSVLPVSATQVDVQFSSEVDQTTAEQEGHYVFDSGLMATSATRDGSDHRLVHLTTNTHYDDFVYTLTVNGVASEGSKETAVWPNNERKFIGKSTAFPTGYIVDDADTAGGAFTTVGYWRLSSYGDCYGVYKHYHAKGGGDSTATWTTAVDSAGQYAVFFWVNHGDYTADAQYIIHTAVGPDTVIADQNYEQEWNSLGTFPFSDTARVTVTNYFTTGQYVIADAIRWVYIEPISSQAPPAAVDDLASFKSGGDIVLTWTAVTTDTLGNPETVDGYVIYRNSDAAMVPGDSIGTAVETEYTDSGAAGSTGTNYFYVVRAVDDAQAKSEPSNQVGEFDRELMTTTKGQVSTATIKKTRSSR
jgi:uncharacterized lipoprotein YddW (UPF0748 family)